MALMLAGTAHAISFQQAKSQGLVGEMPDGYIDIVQSGASDDIKALVDDINQKRREEYQRISQENNQPVTVVEKLAAEKLIGRLGSGQYYKKSGKWVRK